MAQWTQQENDYFLKLCYKNTPHQVLDCEAQFINFMPVAYEMEMKFNIDRTKQECLQHYIQLSKSKNPLSKSIDDGLHKVPMAPAIEFHITPSKSKNNYNTNNTHSSVSKQEKHSKEKEAQQKKPQSKKHGYTITAGDQIWWYNPHGSTNNMVFRASIITSINKEVLNSDNKLCECIKYWPVYSRVQPTWNDEIKIKWG